jgi:hypothetical protein
MLNVEKTETEVFKKEATSCKNEKWRLETGEINDNK